MNRRDLKARVAAARIELQAAERDLADSYGASVGALAVVLLGVSDGQLKRWSRLLFDGADACEVYPSTDLRLAVARALADWGYGAAVLRRDLYGLLPDRRAQIDTALALWGAP